MSIKDKFLDYKEQYETLKENQGFRYIVISIVIIILVAFFVLGKEKTDLSALIEPAPTSLFGEDQADKEMQAYEINQLVDDLDKRFKDEQKQVEKRELSRQQELQRIQEKNTELQQAVFSLSSSLKAMNDSQRELDVTRSNKNQALQESVNIPGDGQVTQAPNQTNTFYRPQNQIVSEAPQVFGNNIIRTITQRQIAEVNGKGEVKIRDTGLRSISERERVVTDERIASKQAEENRVQEQFDRESQKFVLSSGSILSAVLLNGVAAPTGSASTSEPIPVLARVKKEAIMPNFFSLDIRECHIIGIASGRLRDQRAYIRTDKISCITEDGKSIESKLQAVAVSKTDGMVGIKGTMVFTGNELLENSMYAGFLSGFAQAVSPRQVNAVNTDPGASALWQSQNFSNYGAAGLGEGVSNASERLADYYMELADQVAPVIELLPGIEVDFIVTGATTFDMGK
jgi:conjugal transfer pilus assembly protein TraB